MSACSAPVARLAAESRASDGTRHGAAAAAPGAARVKSLVAKVSRPENLLRHCLALTLPPAQPARAAGRGAAVRRSARGAVYAVVRPGRSRHLDLLLSLARRTRRLSSPRRRPGRNARRSPRAPASRPEATSGAPSGPGRALVPLPKAWRFCAGPRRPDVGRSARRRKWTLNWSEVTPDIVVGSCPRSPEDVVRPSLPALAPAAS